MEVFYRIYPGSGDNRPFFDGDKLALTYACLMSFMESCVCSEQMPSGLTFIMDDCPLKWTGMIQRIVEIAEFPHCIRVVTSPDTGNKPSFQHQLGLALESKESTVYLAEDDYLYRPEAIEKMSLFERHRNFGDAFFWTPYDHPDRYLRNDDRNGRIARVDIFGENGRHWRTVESACMTFGGPKHLFVEIQDILRKHGCTGRQMWYPIIDAGYKLWSPIPSLATHLESDHLAMCVDWQEVLRSTLNKTFGYSPTMWVPLKELLSELMVRLEKWR